MNLEHISITRSTKKTAGTQPFGSRKVMIGQVLLVIFLFHGLIGVKAVRADDAITQNIETEASYTMGSGDSRLLGRTLALFRAKRKAARQAAERFAEQRLIQFVDRDKRELVLLTADSLHADVLQLDFLTQDGNEACVVRARITVKLSDFVEAELASLRLGAEEDLENYHDEMEPEIPLNLRPGHALAKAYRLIDKREIRLAVIYLDRLARQYPGWGEIDEIKALALGRPSP